MSQDNPPKTETESTNLEHETENSANKATSKEDNLKTDVVLPIDEDCTPSKEVVIDVEVVDVSDDKTGNTVDSLVDWNGASKIKPPQVTMVYQVNRIPLIGNVIGTADTGTKERRFRAVGMDVRETYGEPLEYEKLNPKTRNAFVIRVFLIVLIMLLVTAVFVTAVLAFEPWKRYFQHYGIIYGLVGLLVMFLVNYAVICTSWARKYPVDLICLSLAVFGMTCICVFITVRYETKIIYYAAIGTIVVVSMCVLLAMSRFDFTSWWTYIVVFGMTLVATFSILGILICFIGFSVQWLYVLHLSFFTGLMVIMIIIELQMILGDNSLVLCEREYALAAYLLYASIVGLFVKMVEILTTYENICIMLGGDDE